MLKNKRVQTFLLGSLIFLLFVLFSYLVHENVFTQFDFDTTVRLQDDVPRRLDGFFSWLSEIGKFEPMLILLIILLFLKRRLWGIIAFGLFGMFHLIEIYGKVFVDHLPPPHFLLRTQHLVDFPQFHVRLENSYPSGHAGRAVFLTVFLGIWVWQSHRFKKWQKILIISIFALYDFLMIMSRVYLGEHWTTDVVGGTLLGGSLALIASGFVHEFKPRKNEPKHTAEIL